MVNYHNTVQAKNLLKKLPNWFKSKVDSNLYRLLNPYGNSIEQFSKDIVTTSSNLNPSIMNFGMPSSIFVTNSLAKGYTPTTATGGTLIEATDLHEFTYGDATSFGTLSAETSLNNPNENSTTGATNKIIDFHHLSPLIYIDSNDELQELDRGYVALHEGIWISDNLISIYDKDMNFIESLTISAIEQKGSSYKKDEWVEQKDLIDNGTGFDYNLKYPYLVNDTLRVIAPMMTDPDTELPLEVTTGVTTVLEDYKFSITLANTLTLTYEDNSTININVKDTPLIVEYEYMQNPILNAFTFTNNYHSVLAANTPNSLPLAFSFLAEAAYELSGLSSYTSSTIYTHSSYPNKENVRIVEQSITESEGYVSRKYTFDGHEVREGASIEEHYEVKGDYSTTLTLNTNGAAATSAITNLVSVEDVTIVHQNNYDISHLFDITIANNIISISTTETNAASAEVTLKAVVIIKDTVSLIAARYTSNVTETFEIVTPGSTETFYSGYPYAASRVVKDADDTVLTSIDTVNGYSFTVDSSSLTAGDTITVTYDGYTKTYERDGKTWYHTMAKPEALYIGDTYILMTSVIKTNEASSSLAWYSHNIYLEDNYFSKCLLSLDPINNNIKLFTLSGSKIGHKLLGGTKYELETSASSSTTTVYSTGNTTETAVCVREFNSKIIVLFRGTTVDLNNPYPAITSYTLKVYDIHTMDVIFTKDITTSSMFINSFTIDKNQDIIICGTKANGTSYTASIPFKYDYYYSVASETEDEVHMYFRDKHADLTLTDADNNTLNYTNSDFEQNEEILEHSIDQHGRTIGSDRWYNEDHVDYLDRLYGITKAQGNDSLQKAIDGISSTFKYPTYNVTVSEYFDLSKPYSTGGFVRVTLNGNYDYNNYLENNTDTNTGTTLTADTHFTIEEEPSLLHITDYNSVSTDTIEVEIVYETTELDLDESNLIFTEYFTTNKATSVAQEDAITLNSLRDSSYLDTFTIERNNIDSTGIYNSTLIKYIQEAGAAFNFKWGEFEWDRYEWADGSNILTGLPTYLDAITKEPSSDNLVTSQVFTSGTAGHSLKYMGKDEYDTPQVHTGHFYLLDNDYFLYNTLEYFKVDPTGYIYGDSGTSVTGTWYNGKYTPLISSFDDTAAPTYTQEGGVGPTVVSTVATGALSVSTNSTGTNAFGSTTLSITNLPANNTIRTTAGLTDFQVFFNDDSILTPAEDSDFTYDASAGNFTNDTTTTHDFSIVHSGAFLGTNGEPTGHNIQLPYIDKYNYHNGTNKTEYSDSTRLQPAIDFAELTNTSTLINSDLDSAAGDITAPVAASTYGIRHAAQEGTRDWSTTGTTDLRLDIPTTAHYVTLDPSYDLVTSMDTTIGPSLNSKNFNIGNTMLGVGLLNSPMAKIEIWAEKTIVNVNQTILIFAKVLDEENGRIKGKPLSLDWGATWNPKATTGEDGIAIFKLIINTSSLFNSTATLTISSEITGETMTGTITLHRGI